MGSRSKLAPLRLHTRCSHIHASVAGRWRHALRLHQRSIYGACSSGGSHAGHPGIVCSWLSGEHGTAGSQLCGGACCSDWCSFAKAVSGLRRKRPGCCNCHAPAHLEQQLHWASKLCSWTHCCLQDSGGGPDVAVAIHPNFDDRVVLLQQDNRVAIETFEEVGDCWYRFRVDPKVQ